MSDKLNNENEKTAEVETEEVEMNAAEPVPEDAAMDDNMDAESSSDPIAVASEEDEAPQNDDLDAVEEPVGETETGDADKPDESIEPQESPAEGDEDVESEDESGIADEPSPGELEDSELAEALSAAEAMAAESAQAQADAELEADEAEDEEPEQQVEEVPLDDRKWYVIHCYSGYENKVRHNLEQRIETMGMKTKIFDVVVPTEEEIEVKDGKRRTVERRVFPGYILVQMLMDEDSWYVVRNTPGVTGFVGMGNDPTPLRPEEVSSIVKRMEAEAPRIKVTYKQGQKVRIIDGPFNDFIGTVSEIDMERAKVRVMVSFFGRETPVELDFLQVEKA